MSILVFFGGVAVGISVTVTILYLLGKAAEVSDAIERASKWQ